MDLTPKKPGPKKGRADFKYLTKAEREVLTSLDKLLGDDFNARLGDNRQENEKIRTMILKELSGRERLRAFIDKTWPKDNSAYLKSMRAFQIYCLREIRERFTTKTDLKREFEAFLEHNLGVSRSHGKFGEAVQILSESDVNFKSRHLDLTSDGKVRWERYAAHRLNDVDRVVGDRADRIEWSGNSFEKWATKAKSKFKSQSIKGLEKKFYAIPGAGRTTFVIEREGRRWVMTWHD